MKIDELLVGNTGQLQPKCPFYKKWFFFANLRVLITKTTLRELREEAGYRKYNILQKYFSCVVKFIFVSSSQCLKLQCHDNHFHSYI